VSLIIILIGLQVSLFKRIPLERGREIAVQYGVAPLLAPLFDFTPNAGSLASLPGPHPIGVIEPRPLSASSSYGSVGVPASYTANMPSTLAPPPILPGSALRLLNQGRAQGLFMPSNSNQIPSNSGGYASPGLRQGGPSQPASSGLSSPPPQNQQSLKRHRSEADADRAATPTQNHFTSSFPTQPFSQPLLDPPADIQMSDGSRPSSTGPRINGEEGPSPSKRLRKDASPPNQIMWQLSSRSNSHPSMKTDFRMPAFAPSNGVSQSSNLPLITEKENQVNESSELHIHVPRFASKPSTLSTTRTKDTRREGIVAAICQRDDPIAVLDLLCEAIPTDPSVAADIDLVIDDHGHTALHLASSLGRQHTVEALITSGADIHRGNYLGETPLIRACLSTHNADRQTFHTIVASLNQSIRTLDTSRKSVIHHVVSLAGVKGRAIAARYYLDQIFLWIAEHQGGDFSSFVDLQDEHGDTALNIAARVGNRSLVRTLLDVGANRILPNKLGLRPGDFGVETEVQTSITKNNLRC
jgi:regulatory protein SWI6